MRLVPILLSLLMGTAPALACGTAGTGAKCVSVGDGLRAGAAGHWQRAPATAAPPPLRVGARLEDDRFNALIGTDYLGLPPARDGWVYVRVDRRIYRVDFRTRQVLGLVSD